MGDEMANEALLSEEKAKKAMVDAARLADEPRTEQELAQVFERDRKLYECQVKDMQTRLDEAETNALKGGKKAMNKMETKNHERMQALVDQLQSKIKSYKKQIEEAEEIAALNLAKFRQAQAQLGDAAQTADLNETALAKAKARGRSGSIGPL